MVYQELSLDKTILVVRVAIALGGAVMLAREFARFRRRRQNPSLEQDPTMDRWLRWLAWCALAFLGICLVTYLNEAMQGPKSISRILLFPMFAAAAGAGCSVCVVGWRNGMRRARARN